MNSGVLSFNSNPEVVGGGTSAITQTETVSILKNGIVGIDSIIDMIKDTIDSGDTEGAKDWLTQLQEHFGEVNNS